MKTERQVAAEAMAEAILGWYSSADGPATLAPLIEGLFVDLGLGVIPKEDDVTLVSVPLIELVERVANGETLRPAELARYTTAIRRGLLCPRYVE